MEISLASIVVMVLVYTGRGTSGSQLSCYSHNTGHASLCVGDACFAEVTQLNGSTRQIVRRWGCYNGSAVESNCNQTTQFRIVECCVATNVCNAFFLPRLNVTDRDDVSNGSDTPISAMTPPEGPHCFESDSRDPRDPSESGVGLCTLRNYCFTLSRRHIIDGSISYRRGCVKHCVPESRPRTNRTCCNQSLCNHENSTPPPPLPPHSSTREDPPATPSITTPIYKPPTLIPATGSTPLSSSSTGMRTTPTTSTPTTPQPYNFTCFCSSCGNTTDHCTTTIACLLELHFSDSAGVTIRRHGCAESESDCTSSRPNLRSICCHGNYCHFIDEIETTTIASLSAETETRTTQASPTISTHTTTSTRSATLTTKSHLPPLANGYDHYIIVGIAVFAILVLILCIIAIATLIYICVSKKSRKLHKRNTKRRKSREVVDTLRASSPVLITSPRAIVYTGERSKEGKMIVSSTNPLPVVMTVTAITETGNEEGKRESVSVSSSTEQQITPMSTHRLFPSTSV